MEDNKCRCGADHHGHLCILRSKGLKEEITKITTNPQFYCFTCGGEADCSENLCEPTRISQ